MEKSFKNANLDNLQSNLKTALQVIGNRRYYCGLEPL